MNENESLVQDQKRPLPESSLPAGQLADGICAEPRLGALREFALMTCFLFSQATGGLALGRAAVLSKTAAALSVTTAVSQRTCRGVKEETGR